MKALTLEFLITRANFLYAVIGAGVYTDTLAADLKRITSELSRRRKLAYTDFYYRTLGQKSPKIFDIRY